MNDPIEAREIGGNENLFNLRASSVGLFLKCPRALKDKPNMPIRQTSEFAETGTRIHAAMQNYITKGIVPEFDRDEDIYLFRRGRYIWDNQLLPYFPTPDVEISLKTVVDNKIDLTGHADVIQIGTDFVAIIDWKTGYVERDYSGQMLAYALLASRYYKKPKAIVSIAYLRSGHLETKEYVESDLAEFELKLIEQVVFGNNYTVGDHCGFCPMNLECPARREMIKSSVSDISNLTIDIEGLIKKGILDDVFSASKMLKRSIKIFEDALKEYVLSNDSALETDKANYTIDNRERKGIIPTVATPTLKNHFTQSEIMSMVKIDKKAMEQAIMSHAERGEKTLAKLSLIAELQDAGAIETKPYVQLTRKEK